MDAKRSPIDDRAAHFLSRIEASRNLPSLPQVLLKLIEACRNEETTIRDISQIVSGDSALSARILGIVNSPFYRRAEKISRIDDALFQLGRDSVRNIGCERLHPPGFLEGQWPVAVQHEALLAAHPDVCRSGPAPG